MGCSSSVQVPEQQTPSVPPLKYHIEVETSKRLGAGTDATVSIIIVGTHGETQALELKKWFHDDFEPGQVDQYTVEGKDVGSLTMIRLLKTCKIHNSDWLVNRITIRKQQELYYFPCYRWVNSELVIFEGKALLARDMQDPSVKQERLKEIQQRQMIYRWGDDPRYSVDLPGFIKAKNFESLPNDAQFTGEALNTFDSAKRKGLENLALVHLFGLFNSWDDFDDYRKCFTAPVGDVPLAADHWQDDVWYGTQFLNACNPESIKRCTELPAHFPVTDESLNGLLDNGMSLKEAMEDGRVYMVDNKILEDIPHFGENDPEKERRYTSASMGLFYVRNNGDLVPIAIQLHQEPSETNPIWTPNDSKYDWIFAKLWLRNADCQWHQVIAHLLRCHLVIEAITLATWRQLPSPHPVWKLLFPHTKGVLAINTVARDLLVADGGFFDQIFSIGGGGHITLAQKYYRTMTMESYNLPKVLKERGVDEADKLPRFYYRDDTLLLWNAIHVFVTEMVGIYYSSDSDVVQDEELQNWARDIHDNGFPSKSETSVDKGLPTSYTTRDSLVHFLTIVIFTSSCQHAAVNFSQMDTYGFQPNGPVTMRKPPPVKKGEVGLQHIMESLANKHQSCINIALMYDLTQIFPTEKFLGDYSEGLFTDEAALQTISRFKGNLKKITTAIEDRNKTLDTPYIYLLPERVPNSIAI